MSGREEILAAIPEIPALPIAATQVISLAQRPDTGIGEIMQAIEYDSGLTSDMLRLANTAYFAVPRTVGSLREAGVLFGTQRIVELVLASSVFPVTKQPVAGYDLPAGELVRQSMALAIGAEHLASVLGRPAPTHTFTAALLSDIGKIVLGTFLKVDAQPILNMAEQEGLSFEVAERRVLGIDHAEVGAELLREWNLPENVINVVRWHHEPDAHPEDRYVVDLVHVANHIAVSCGLGIGVDGLNYRPAKASLERLGVDHTILEKTTCHIVAELSQIQHQLPGNAQGD